MMGLSHNAMARNRYPGALFSAHRRHLHVRARLDVTCRIKDVLRLLESMGFLRPVPTTQLPEDLFSELLNDAEPPELDDDHSADDSHTEAEEKGHVSGHARMSLGLAGGLGSRPPEREQSPRSRALSALEVLRILCETLSPQCLELLRWQLPPGASPDEISVLEFLENEMVFPEFLRLLSRCEEHYEAFVRNFVPALSERPKREDGFWHGFEGPPEMPGGDAYPELIQAPRRWPRGFELELAQW